MHGERRVDSMNASYLVIAALGETHDILRFFPLVKLGRSILPTTLGSPYISGFVSSIERLPFVFEYHI